MAEFKLKTGEAVIVDAKDFERVYRLKWHISNGYAKHSYRSGGKVCSLYLHEFIRPGIAIIGHHDGNRLNNRRHNLRPANNSRNQANSKKRSTPCSSRFKGVYWAAKSGKWCAQISVPRRYLGLFNSEEKAARAYDDAARVLWGKFARLNLPQDRRRK